MQGLIQDLEFEFGRGGNFKQQGTYCKYPTGGGGGGVGGIFKLMLWDDLGIRYFKHHMHIASYENYL